MKKGFSPLTPVFLALLLVFVVASGDVAYRAITHKTAPIASTIATLLHVDDSTWFKTHFGTLEANSSPSSASVITGSSTTTASTASQGTHPTIRTPQIATSSEASAQAVIQTRLALALPSLRSAGVNILCAPKDLSKKAISGSGVIIDGRGVILTAAHVGQYVLLQDYPKKGTIACAIRTGSPATSAYTASVLYISKTWIIENPRTMTTTAPIGTGENDFALLAITGTTGSTTLPNSFPYVPLSSEIPTKGEPTVIGSYGAEFTDPAHIKTGLFPTLVFGKIQEVYTFGTNTVDLISLGGNAAAQEGSSGGGVINAAGELIGLITTSSTDGNFLNRDLHAITPGHIRRSFAIDMGQDLTKYLASGTPSALAQSFITQGNSLADVLLHAH